MTKGLSFLKLVAMSKRLDKVEQDSHTSHINAANRKKPLKICNYFLISIEFLYKNPKWLIPIFIIIAVIYYFFFIGVDANIVATPH